jgi:hypothetical protein
MGRQFNMTQMLLPAMGLLFIGVGRMLRTARRNYFIGIRTPWTLASDAVWQATHALGARTFTVGGIVSIAAGFLGEARRASAGRWRSDCWPTGETVVDVPAKLSARVRVFDTGNARKTDPVDAHAVAMAALRTPKLKVLTFDEQLVALRLLADRRDELSALRVQTVNRLHRLFTELIPGGAPR